MNPQRELERLTSERLRLREAIRVYPRTFIVPVSLAVQILLAIFLRGTASDVFLATAVALAIVAFIAAPWVFEGFYNDRTEKRLLSERRARARCDRTVRKGPRVLAVPHGDYVTIHTWHKLADGSAQHHRARFHAEDQSEEAQEYVADFRARALHEADSGPSPDATALARALNR